MFVYCQRNEESLDQEGDNFTYYLWPALNRTENYPDKNMTKIIQNTEESAGVWRELVAT